MLKAKRKRLREEQESMDVDAVTYPSSSQSPRPTKRACADNVRILKEEDHIPTNTCIPTAEVSKLEPPAVKRTPARNVDFGAAELMSNASGGFGQDDQDDKEEVIARRCYRDEGDGIMEEAKDGLLNDDDEVNGHEQMTDSYVEARRQYKNSKSFEKRMEVLHAFKAKHGHVRVTAKHDKNLARFCEHMRSARRGTRTTRTITNDRIKALDELGFYWGHKNASFEKRIEELQAFRAKHGHVRVTVKHDKTLYEFCANMRSARRNPGTGMTITDDRIKALDELGFAWEDKIKSFEKRIEELQAFRAKHGHVRVTVTHDKRLYEFCANMRSAGRNPGTGMAITDDRIKALDELGFTWEGGKRKSFEESVEELEAFKAKHGHVRVTAKHDKNLGSFCAEMRWARRWTGIQALDDLGFEWAPGT